MKIIRDKTFQLGFISGLTLAGLFLIIQRQLIKQKQSKQKQGQLDQQEGISSNKQESDELMREQLVRNYQFFGEDSQKKIEGSYVMIFGIGGVGSHVLSCLARSGVGEIAIIDFDRVTLSSLNRHAFATREHVGRSKVEVFVKFLKDIVPHLKVNVFESYVNPDNVSDYFQNQRKPSFVIDCIDNMEAKTALVAYCVQNKIKVISSCGAGMKADPTKIQIRDISQSSYDDLAKSLRMRLKKYKIKKGVIVVFSNEINDRVLLPLKEHQINKVDEYQPFKNYRIRIVPVMGAMPALIAYSISSYVLCQLAEQPFKPTEMDDVKQSTYNRLFQMVLTMGKKNGVRAEDLNIDVEDMYIIARETYNWTCFICNKKSLAVELVLWDPQQPISIKNLVPMYGECSKKHQQKIIDSSDLLQQYDKTLMDQKIQMDIIIDKIVDSKKVLFN